MRLYTTALFAESDGAFDLLATAILATSENEARDKALAHCKSEFPGRRRYIVSVADATPLVEKLARTQRNG